MSPTPPPSACANCVSTKQPAVGIPGAPALPGAPTPSSMVRSAEGKLRIDMPNLTVITNPKAQQAIVLNHLTKEAQVLPMMPKPPQAPSLPQAPGAPPVPGSPQMPPIAALALGKSLIEGHPVEGVRYVVQLPAGPQIVSEIWTSCDLKMPVLTKVTTPAGIQTTYCKPTAIPEPDPSLFQVPPGYKVLPPKV
jgi:hypothetical protein